MSLVDPGGARGAVHQFVPAYIPRDATGTHTRLLREALREAGWRSEIYAEATHDELVGDARPIGRYAEEARPGDVGVYQFSTSSMVADLLLARPEPLILDYHNVTAPELYGNWDPASAADEFLLRPRFASRGSLFAGNICDGCRNILDLRNTATAHASRLATGRHPQL